MVKNAIEILSKILKRDVLVNPETYVEDNPYFLAFIYCVSMYSLEFMDDINPDDCDCARNIIVDLLREFIRFLENTDGSDQDRLSDSINTISGTYTPREYSVFSDIMPTMINMFFNTCVLIATGRHSVAKSMVRIFRFIDRYVEHCGSENNTYFDKWFKTNFEHLRKISDNWGERPV